MYGCGSTATATADDEVDPGEAFRKKSSTKRAKRLFFIAFLLPFLLLFSLTIKTTKNYTILLRPHKNGI